MKVRLSPLAEEKIRNLLSFIEKEWSTKAKEEYLKKFLKSVNQISNHPNSCPQSSNPKGVFKCVVTKQSSFYYRISNDQIEIITLIDNRQDPATIRKWIKTNFG
ncbi:MAG: type II toxin-antitoxin system RelE/ParE family toxin [Flavobacteriales bacterium]|nr:type II toxin-antitoxin system RelE/ParE family toxin [Flavobacteriales bacterium]